MKKVGILGGTFDPPHLGHLIIAQEALEACHLDEVWFLPSFIPPHKERVVTAAEHRIKMVEQAIKDNASFKLSLLEYNRKGRSYTYDTLKELRENYPNDSFYFIIGADMVNDIPNWYRAEDLNDLAHFIGFCRPGFTITSPNEVDIISLEMPEVDISSSMIRSRIKEQRHYRYFLTESVKNYIEEKGLYEES